MPPQNPLPPIGAEVVPELPPLGGEVVARSAGVQRPAPTPAAPLPFGVHGLAPGVDLATGIVKGVGNTVIGLGEAAYRYIPGVAAVSDATQRAIFGDVVPATTGGLFSAARQTVQPTTPLQQIGYTGEQLGEFFVPLGQVGRAAKVGEVLRSGGVTLAQTGSAPTAGVSAGLTATLVPGMGWVLNQAGRLGASAEKTMVGALGPTKEWAKAEAARIAPGMFARGVKGSRPAMLARAETMVTDVGKQIGDEVAAAAAAGQTVSGAAVLQAIRTASDGLHIVTPRGASIPIAGTEPVIGQLNKLTKFVQQLGPDIPFDQAAKIKTTWDRIVSKAGLYGPKAQASATDSAAGWSIREAASSFRDLLAKGSLTLDDLNQEYAFWKGLRNVLKETEKRTQPQGSGLISGVTGGMGVVGGLASGEGVEDKLQNALVYGVMGRQLVRVMQSPSWATYVSAPMKNALADALASGSAPRVSSVMQRIMSALPAQVRSEVTVP